MSVSRLRAEVRRLRREVPVTVPENECDHPALGAIVEEGGPVPADAPRCPNCGGLHVLVIREEVVEAIINSKRA
jgi:hypothetical protein